MSTQSTLNMSLYGFCQKGNENEKEESLEPAPKPWFWERAYSKVYNLPFTGIIRYVYNRDPRLLCTVVGLNFIVPPAMELFAPWYLVPNKLLSEYMELQSDIRTHLGHSDPTSVGLLLMYKVVGVCLWYTALKSLDRYVLGKLDLRLRMLMRRLVMEKIIYSEMGSVEKAYEKKLGIKVEPRVLERQLIKDLNDTMGVIFVKLPNTFTISSRLANHLYALYMKREQLNWILISYPFLYHFLREVVGAVTTWELSEKLDDESHKARRAMGKLISNTVAGLSGKI